jgi:hypothetical protein
MNGGKNDHLFNKVNALTNELEALVTAFCYCFIVYVQKHKTMVYLYLRPDGLTLLTEAMFSHALRGQLRPSYDRSLKIFSKDRVATLWR